MDSSLAQKGVSFGIAGSLQREMATEEIELVARSQSGGSAPAHMTLQKVSGTRARACGLSREG